MRESVGTQKGWVGFEILSIVLENHTPAHLIFPKKNVVRGKVEKKQQGQQIKWWSTSSSSKRVGRWTAGEAAHLVICLNVLTRTCRTKIIFTHISNSALQCIIYQRWSSKICGAFYRISDLETSDENADEADEGELNKGKEDHQKTKQDVPWVLWVHDCGGFHGHSDERP